MDKYENQSSTELKPTDKSRILQTAHARSSIRCEKENYREKSYQLEDTGIV